MSGMVGESPADGSSASASPPGTEHEPSSLGLVQFGFHAKTAHDAEEALLQTRSENYKVPPPTTDNDVWKRPPPDFRWVKGFLGSFGVLLGSGELGD